jgi:ABC-2 type transport system permease protein
MSTAAAPLPSAATGPRPSPLARPRGWLHDTLTVGRRAVRDTLRDPEAVIPGVVIAAFFYAVNIGSLQNVAEGAAPGFDYKAFQLPTAIVFAVTGVSRASSLVLDIKGGYFDRLLLTPVRRTSLLVGLMLADALLVLALSSVVTVMAFVVGVRFETGILGLLVFLLLASLWGLAFTGFPYAIALKTGSPAAVNSSFLIFFPFAFLTTALVPLEALTGWLQTAARFNPMTYLLAGLRSLVMDGWDASALGKAVLAIVGVGVVSQALAFAALRGRVRRG